MDYLNRECDITADKMRLVRAHTDAILRIKQNFRKDRPEDGTIKDASDLQSRRAELVSTLPLRIFQ